MRGQVMLEFVLVVGIAMVIGMAYLIGAYGILNDVVDRQRATELNAIGYSVQDELILASASSDGYQRTFVVPQKAGRFSYNLSSTQNSLTLISGNTVMVYDLPPVLMNQSVNITKGNNTVHKSEEVMVNLG